MPWGLPARHLPEQCPTSRFPEQKGPVNLPEVSAKIIDKSKKEDCPSFALSVQGALSDWGEEKLCSAVIYKDGEQCRLNAFHKKTERVWYTAWIKERTLMVQDVSGCIINSCSVDCDCKR
jgi:hypothetical protein